MVALPLHAALDDALPAAVGHALTHQKFLLEGALRAWLASGLPLSDAALVLECRAEGFVRVQAVDRYWLAGYASPNASRQLRHRPAGGVPLFYKAHSAELAGGRVVWLVANDSVEGAVVIADDRAGSPQFAQFDGQSAA